MIDVLGFPPDEPALAQLRKAELVACRQLDHVARVAMFVSLGLALTWAADVAAAFHTPAGILSMGFGVASLALACTIAGAHRIGRHLYLRSASMRQSCEQRFAEVTIAQAQALLLEAASDRVVAQYLRMVGRQRRALRAIELAALLDWLHSSTACEPAASGELAFA